MKRIEDIVDALRTRGVLANGEAPAGLAVEGISDDSRRVEPGDLYCAIRGHVHDGHRYIASAHDSGAIAALVESVVPDVPIPQVRVRDSRLATAVAAHIVYGEPSKALTLVGVTGTNGKTTTVHLLRHVLSAGRPTASIGTLGIIGPSGDREAIDLTTPGPVQLTRALARLRDAGTDTVVAEVSSHALVQERVAGLEFGAAVFTNLTRDHLDYHSDLEGYRRAKLKLADRLREDGVVVVNADETAWAELGRRPGAVRFGMESPDAEFTARDRVLEPTASRWQLVAPAGTASVRLGLPGDFNISNALAAAATAAALGSEVERIARSLSEAPPVPGRLEVLAESPYVLRDFAHTPDALARALAALRPLTRGRLIVVFGCGGERDPGKRPLMGRMAAQGADLVIVTSDNPRREDPEAIIRDIRPGVQGSAHEVIVDRRAAIARALAIAAVEDVVLLAGKGHETYQVVGTERRPFDEAQVVAELRADMGGAP